jgi:hypothetical protein
MDPHIEAFAADLQARLRRSALAHLVAARGREHAQHPIAAKARVVSGEMWLTLRGETRNLLPGNEFELAAGEAHAERYGEAGTTYWVGRRA